jgi:putative ABC transport system permease protein
VAPSYFFVDIQPDQIEGFLARVKGDPAVSRVDTAPMLRGVLTRINGRDARAVAGDHWVLRGDRGLTYSAAPPERTVITAGAWWPEDYAGPPQMSFARAEAEEMGLKLHDRVTVNVLGRDIEAGITSFREVDFGTGGIGFVMVMNPAALSGAPHSWIATVYADPAAEAAILRDLADAWPNITAIRVKDAIDRVSEALAAIARATAIAAGVTLLTGVVVLIGAAAAGERARVQEAAVLKTLGATRATVLASFALRSALMGAAAGQVAVAFGAAAGWAVMRFVMEGSFRFEPVSAVAIVTGGALVTLVAGLLFALRPLSARPAQVLRARG